MEYRNLGKTGLKVSELCLGTMQFGWSVDEPGSFEVLNAAYSAGLTFIDTADVYSRWVPGNPGGVSETIIGNWMKKFDIPRSQVILATKVRGRMGTGPNDEGLSRRHIFEAVDASLRRLQTDYIDLYQTHHLDPATPIEETLSALDDLVHAGKVRYIGCSNYPAWRLMQALWTSEKNHLARFDCLQPHYNLVHRDEFERELADVCRTYGVGVIPYSPLAAGFLSGKYRKEQPEPDSVRLGRVRSYFTDRNWVLLEKMDIIAQTHGKSLSAVALGWMLTDPVISSPIIGPRSLEQLHENLQAAGFRLTPEEKATLDQASDWRNG
ncbi:MAG TPA: aldo/keto reductase [Anaerolineaceae bacterium]